jgi:hypothetical protein
MNLRLSTLALVFIAGPSYGQQLVGSGWTAPAYGIGTMGGDLGLSQWETILPYGAKDLQINYNGFGKDANANIEIKAAQVTINSGNSSTVYNLTFSGQTATTLSEGSINYTDKLKIDIAPGSVASVRTLYSAPYYPSIGTGYYVSNTQGVSYGQNLSIDSPININSNPTWMGLPNMYRFYSPGYAIGLPSDSYHGNTDTVITVGNSHAVGYVDFGEAFIGDPNPASGWQIRAFNGVHPVVKYGAGGSTAASFLYPSSTNWTGPDPYAVEGMSVTNTGIWEYGHNELRINNDVNTIGQSIISDMTIGAEVMAEYNNTLTLTTMWKFKGWNERPDSEIPEMENQRNLVNNYIRNNYSSVGYNVINFYDFDKWVSGPDGYILPAYNGDELHLNSLGNQAIANNIRASFSAPEPSGILLILTTGIFFLRRKR